MFKVSASLVHVCLQSLKKVLDSPCHRLQTTLEMIWNDLHQKPVASNIYKHSWLSAIVAGAQQGVRCRNPNLVRTACRSMEDVKN